jgi:hypothetical protein
VSDREIKMAEKAGYECAFVNFDGGFGNHIERFSIREYTLPPTCGWGNSRLTSADFTMRCVDGLGAE